MYLVFEEPGKEGGKMGSWLMDQPESETALWSFNTDIDKTQNKKSFKGLKSKMHNEKCYWGICDSYILMSSNALRIPCEALLLGPHWALENLVCWWHEYITTDR